MDIITFVIEPNDTLVPSNGIAKVGCNVNQGNVKYTWLKYNKQSRNYEQITQTQHISVNKGGLLIVRDDPSVVGRYRCKAILANFAIVVSRLFRIDVANLYINKLTQRQLGSGEYKIRDVAVLICPFWTVPQSEAEYRWYFKKSNGKRIIQMSHISVLHIKGKLLEIEVDRSSFGSYFCEVVYSKYGLERTSPLIEIRTSSNIYDPKTGDQLSWVAKPVESLLLDRKELYSRQMKIINGNDVLIIREGTHRLELLCAARSERGELKITWLKDQIVIERVAIYFKRFSYEIIGQGTLVLINITEQYSGEYTCKAYVPRKDKAILTSVKVVVRQNLRFTIKPAPIVIGDVSKEILLSCQINDGETRTIISWRKNGELISSNNYLQQNDGLMRISRLLESDEGVFQCFAEDEFSSLQTMVQMKINKAISHIIPDSRPLPVKNLQVKTASYRTLNISWSHANEGFDTILHYEIVLIDLSNLSTRNNKITIKADRMETSVLVKNLIPDSFHRIYVSAVNGSGTSYPAIIKSSPRVLSKVPTEIPSKVFVTDVGSGVATIHWIAPLWDEMNGELLGYRIVISGIDGIFISSKDVNKNYQHVKILELIPDTKYSVRIQVLSRGGQGPLSDKVTFETKRFDNDHDTIVGEIERHKPNNNDYTSTDLHVKLAGEITKWRVKGHNTSIAVQWTHPSTGGQVEHYKIKWGKVYPGPNEVILQYPASSYVIDNLEVQTQYMIKVIPVNNVGDGKELLFSQFTGNVDIKKTPIPLNLGLKSIGMDSAIISWEDPNTDLSITRLYQVRYNVLDKESIVTYLKNTTENNVQIVGLLPSTSYEYSVRTGDIVPSQDGDYLEKEWMWSEWSLKESFTTVGEKPKHGPQDFSISTLGKPSFMDNEVATKVLVSWSLPYDKSIRTYDEILGYIVFFTETPRIDLENWHNQVLPKDQFTSKITLKGKEKIYYFRVGCRTVNFKCPLSRILIYKTADAYGLNFGLLPIPKEYYYSLDIPEKYLNANPIRSDEHLRENAKVISRDGIWLIVGTIFGGLVLVTMLLIIIFICCKRRPKSYFTGYTLGMKSPSHAIAGVGFLLSNQPNVISNAKVSPHFPSSYSQQLQNPDLFSHSDVQFVELENDSNQDNESLRFTSVSQHHLASASTGGNMFNPNIQNHALMRSHPQMAYYPEMAAHSQNSFNSTTVINPLISLNNITIQNEISDTNLQMLQQQNLIYPFSSHLFGPTPICSSSCLQPIHLSPHMLTTQGHCSHNTPSYSNAPRINASELASNASSEDIRPLVHSPRVNDSDISQYYGNTVDSTIKSHRSKVENSSMKANITCQRSSDSGSKQVITRDSLENDVMKCFSTEELSQEMANLEGLMKDLTAITQKEFEC